MCSTLLFGRSFFVSFSCFFGSESSLFYFFAFTSSGCGSNFRGVFLEFFYATSSVNEFLFASIKRMALVAQFDRTQALMAAMPRLCQP